MGLKYGGDRKDMTYLRINGQTGRFVESVKNAETGKYEGVEAPEGTTLTGYLRGLSVVSDKNSEGKLAYKLKMKFEDPDPTGKPMSVEAVLWRQDKDSTDETVGQTNRFALAILAGLYAADLSKPIEMKPWMMQQGTEMPDGKLRERDGSGVAFRQGGERIKPVYLLQGQAVDKLPELPKQVFGGKTFYDKSSWADAAEELRVALTSRLQEAQDDGHLDGHSDDDAAIDPHEAAAAANEGEQRERARA